MHRLAVIIACAALTAVGCDDGRPRRAKVTGTVTYKGQPVSGADVVFKAHKAPTYSTGKTDSNGKFLLTTFEAGDGAFVGLNQVAVTKMSSPVKSSVDLNSPEYAAAMKAPSQGKGPKSEIPVLYANPEKSGLSFTVTEGANDFAIELKD